MPFFASLFGSVISKVLLVGLAGSILTAGFFYVKNVMTENALAKVNQARLEAIIEAKEKVNQENIKALADMAKANKNLNDSFNNAVKQKNDLVQKFQKGTNLQQMAIQHPQLVEDKINRGTIFALRCNEIITGDPIKPTDKDNNICPELVKDLNQPTDQAKNQAIINNFVKTPVPQQPQVNLNPPVQPGQSSAPRKSILDQFRPKVP